MKYIRTILFFLFFLFCFFPYIHILPLKTDAQPNALLLSVFPVLLIKKKKYPLAIYLTGLLLVYALFVFIIYRDFSFNAMRSLMSYFSIFMIVLGTYKLLIYWRGIPINLYKIVILIWAAIGFIQTFFFPNFLNFLLDRSLGTGIAGRGVTSLAPEPTFYGTTCLLFIVIGLCNYDFKIIRGYIVLLAIEILFFSKSTTTLGIIVISLFIYLLINICRLHLKTMLSVLIIGILFFLVAWNTIDLWSNTRIYSVLSKLLDNPTLFIYVDMSINDRLTHVIFPVKGMIDNYFLPTGYNQFETYIDKVINSKGIAEIIMYNQGGYTRIMSGYGSIFFELGGVALLIPLIVFHGFYPFFGVDKYIICFLFISFVFFMGNNFTTALLPFIIGNIIYLRSTRSSYNVI